MDHPRKEGVPLPIWQFRDKAWKATDPSTASWKLEDGASIKIVTFNVWFELKFQAERTKAFIKQMKSLDPDIICLQEVLPSFVTAIKDHKFIRKNYFLCGEENFVYPYGCIILSRFPVNKLVWHELPTRMSRNVLIATCNLNGHPVSFAVVHLESLSNALKRKNQLEIILQDKLKDCADAFLMGDFNFGEVNWDDLQKQKALLDKGTKDLSVIYKGSQIQPENAILASFENWTDTWSKLRPGEHGWTFDTEANKMLAGHRYEQLRYDRILYKTSCLKPKDIKMVGNEPFTKNLHISDHFGLFSTFTLTNS